MEYAFLLWPHANTRYLDSLRKLAHQELQCMLGAVNIPAKTAWQELGGAPWLVVSCPPLSAPALRLISGHSSFYMAATIENGLLRPLSIKEKDYLPSDLAEVLKYKGKTNAAFTRLMLNCALCASAFALSGEPLHIVDPLCGKATSLFCALQRGYHAAGVDIDSRDLQEAGDYFGRYLQMHRIKHQQKRGGITLPGGKNAVFTSWEFSDSPAHYTAGDTRTLQLIHGDTTLTGALIKAGTAHLLIADLPYGVQHAPEKGQRAGTFVSMLKDALPGWRKVLQSGGAIALSFNTYTLKKADLKNLIADTGFTVLETPPYDDFDHWVEQAVQRDLVIARKD
jgi:hypothetical protein